MYELFTTVIIIKLINIIVLLLFVLVVFELWFVEKNWRGKTKVCPKLAVKASSLVRPGASAQKIECVLLSGIWADRSFKLPTLRALQKDHKK